MDVRQVIPKDAIPSVDDPSFGPSYDGEPDDLVIVPDVDDVTRAYPVRYLHYHEIVNDDLPTGGPIAVTWCPLCGSAVVYERTLAHRTLTFGVSGKLADDDLVMYDRETGTEWKQSLGEAIAGDLVGETLTVLPAATTTWGRFRETSPDGEVLQPPGGASEAASDGTAPEPIDYDEEPYREYFEADGFGLGAHRGDDPREWPREDLAPKTVVLGLEGDDEVLGVPFPVVEDTGGVLQVTVESDPVVVFASDGGIHAFRDPGYVFEPILAPEKNQKEEIEDQAEKEDGAGKEDGAEKEDGEKADAGGSAAGTHGFRADGTVWDGATGSAADGRTLERVPARRLFAFAWRDDHGDDAFLVDH